jgi:hypothetical protein
LVARAVTVEQQRPAPVVRVVPAVQAAQVATAVPDSRRASTQVALRVQTVVQAAQAESVDHPRPVMAELVARVAAAATAATVDSHSVDLQVAHQGAPAQAVRVELAAHQQPERAEPAALVAQRELLESRQMAAAPETVAQAARAVRVEPAVPAAQAGPAASTETAATAAAEAMVETAATAARAEPAEPSVQAARAVRRVRPVAALALRARMESQERTAVPAQRERTDSKRVVSRASV